MAVKRAVRDEARRLRVGGMAVNQIAQQLEVSKDSVSVWVRDIKLTEDQIESLRQKRVQYGAQNKGGRSNREKFLNLRQIYQNEGRSKAREQNPLHLAGCMLYWAEGAKDPNSFYFVNSDVNMLRLCARFLREEMSVPDSDFVLHIHCHSNDPIEVQRVEVHWLNTLGLTPSNLRKTVFKQGSESSRNILSNGICGIRILKSVRLIQHIYGAIQAYGGFDNPNWLF